jgi:hypothetical protein
VPCDRESLLLIGWQLCERGDELRRDSEHQDASAILILTLMQEGSREIRRRIQVAADRAP